MKSVYNKFSNDRRVEFAIRTEILEDENSRVVRKHNLYSEGEDYMDQMVEVYDSLRSRFAGLDRVAVLPCKRIKNGVEFPFIKGETVHRLLKEKITKGDKAELFRALEDYLSVVTYQDHASQFQMTDRFQEVFGDAESVWFGKPAVDVSDIDMIPSNLIIDEETGKWTIIDYEWTFLCPVPMKYLRFRSILFWYNECQGHTLATWAELMNFLGVTKEEERQFRAWENHFQSFILNGKVPFREENEMLPGDYVNVPEILNYRKINETKENTVIYVDYGDGYEEEAIAYVSHAKLGNNVVEGSLRIPAGAKRVKFYVSSIFGFGYVSKLVDETEKPINYRLSGKPMNKRMHINLQGFLTLECDVENLERVDYAIYLYEMKENPETRTMASSMLSEVEIAENERLEAYFTSQRRIQDLSSELKNTKNELMNAKMELEAIKSSKWYRLAKKLKRQ